MSAPSADAESSSTEFVVIEVKVSAEASSSTTYQEQEPTYEPSSASHRPTRESSVEIDRKWLTGEFFQAQLQRWNFESNGGPPRISLLLPEGCDAGEGTRLLKLRLGSDETRKRKSPSQSVEARAWSRFDWWRTTEGREEALCAALHIFHFTLQKDFALEVASTLKLYRFRCQPWVVTIARQLEVEVEEMQVVVEPTEVPFSTLEKLVIDAAQYEDRPHFKTLAEQAIKGGHFSLEELMKMLVTTYLSLFHWEHPGVIKVANNDVPRLPFLGAPFPAGKKSRQWLRRLVEDLIHARPDAACACYEALLASLKDTAVMVTAHRSRDGAKGFTSEQHFLEVDQTSVRELYSTCSHALFLDAGLHNAKWVNAHEALCNFARLSSRSSRLDFMDGWTDVDQFFNLEVFAVANPLAQKAWIEAAPPRSLALLKDHVHFVHVSARPSLLKILPGLSDKDLEFLTTVPLSSPNSIKSGVRRSGEQQAEESPLKQRRSSP